jgi:hypothetical protein
MSAYTDARLDALIARLEQLVPGGPVVLSTVPGPVAPGELIESAWGNAVNEELTEKRGAAVRNASVAVSSGQQVAFTWPTILYENQEWLAAGASQLIVPEAGLYVVTLSAACTNPPGVAWSNSPEVILNHSGALYSQNFGTNKSGATLSVSVPMSTGQFLEGRIYNGHSDARFFSLTLSVNYARVGN